MVEHRKFQKLLMRKFMEDPVFGKLEYEEYDSQAKCNFDKTANVCDLPFYDIEIQYNGNVFACCPGWNPASIGNLLEQDLRSIWNGVKAKRYRESILDGTYQYCNAKTCPAMIAGGGPRIIPKAEFVDPHRSIPRNIAFSVDNTCNLVCPSCRTSKIINLSDEDTARALKILRTAFQSVCAQPHDDNVTFTFDGVGEIFFSPVYREIFETEQIFQTPEKWPNIKFVLCTNGTMMTEKIQKKYSVLFNRMLSIRLSIDAGNEDSYNKVRVGGDWSLLFDNINYLYHNTIAPGKLGWAWNLILQKNNYESIPDLIDLAYRYEESLPEIYIVNMLNWGTLDQIDFDEQAVWFPKSSRYNDVKRVLNLDKVKKYPKIFFPNLG